MCKAHISGKYPRTDKFLKDTSVSTQSATKADYYKSGFDRGHLMPAYDGSWNKTAMRESFLMSNVSPQRPGFNRGIWYKLEYAVRGWVFKYDSLCVIQGPILKVGLPEIGESGVEIPELFYKIIYDAELNRCLCFLIPNKKGEHELEHYQVSLETIQALTHITFFKRKLVPVSTSMW